MTVPSLTSARDVLLLTAPSVHGALEHVRAVTDGDGALDAGFKAALMAVTGATQRETSFAARELARAAALGVSAARIWAVAALTLSSRGEGAYERFVETARDHFEPPAGDLAPVAHPDPEDEAAHAEAYLSARTGSLPDYAKLLRDFAPTAFVGYAQLLESAWNQPALSPAEVQLVLTCINVAAIRADFAAHHSRLARAAGASDAEIIEAAICAIPCGGVTAWYGAAGGLL